MKKLLFIIAFLFTSATIFAGPVEKLTKLVDKVEKEHKSYTDEDWEKVAKEYAKLKAEFEEDERTSEELKEFGRQKGRLKGYMSKKTLNKWGKKMGDFANELGGGIGGFFESLEKMIDD